MSLKSKLEQNRFIKGLIAFTVTIMVLAGEKLATLHMIFS